MEKQVITFTCEYKDNANYEEWDNVTKIELNGCILLGDLLNKFKSFCLAIGHHPDCVSMIRLVENEEESDGDLGVEINGPLNMEG